LTGMPTSHYLQINEIIQMVNYIRPVSVLDVGVGFGKYGMLLREYLKFWSPMDELNVRTGRIDGIEIFESYITSGQKYYYDSIYIGNALDIMPKLKSYDLILIIDVLEHLSHDDGQKLLTLCQKKADYVIISTPIKMNVQGPAFGNEFEMHRAQWHPQDFERLPNSARRLNYKSLIYLLGTDSKKIISKIRLENFKVYINYQFPWLVNFLSTIKKIFRVDNTKR
jgi:hypothetical protein